MYTSKDEHGERRGFHTQMRHSKAIHLMVIGRQTHMHDPSEACACNAYFMLGAPVLSVQDLKGAKV